MTLEERQREYGNILGIPEAEWRAAVHGFCKDPSKEMLVHLNAEWEKEFGSPVFASTDQMRSAFNDGVRGGRLLEKAVIAGWLRRCGHISLADAVERGD